MNIEYEATFIPVDKDEMRQRLTRAGARLVKPEFLQRRTVFNPPPGIAIKGGWLRVRDEGDRITMSLKIVDGERITNQHESCLTVNDYQEAVELLRAIGCDEKAYQESKREMWSLNGTEICIDEWPFLEPFVEVEGKDEQTVRAVSEQLGFDWQKAKFCAVGTLYSEKYGLSVEQINDHTPRIVFQEDNPFIIRRP